MYPSSPLRSTLNTGYIAGVDMCKVCTQAVHSVALWTRVTLQVWTCVKYLHVVYAQRDSLLCPKWPPRFMAKVTLFYAQSDPLGEFMPKVTLFSFWGKVHSVVLTCGLCPKWLSFYAQSDPLECRGVNYAQSDSLLCPKWPSFDPKWFMP